VLNDSHVMFPRHPELLVHTRELRRQTLAEAALAMVMSRALAMMGYSTCIIHMYVHTYIHTYIHTYRGGGISMRRKKIQ